MILPYCLIRGAPTVYALTLLVDFCAYHGRHPDDETTLAEWWALPTPLHKRLDILMGIAVAYPHQHAHIVKRAVQEAAILAAEDVLPLWNAAYSDEAPGRALAAARAFLSDPVVGKQVEVCALAKAAAHIIDLPSAFTTAGSAGYAALCAAHTVTHDRHGSTVAMFRAACSAIEQSASAGSDLSLADARLRVLVVDLGAMP